MILNIKFSPDKKVEYKKINSYLHSKLTNILSKYNLYKVNFTKPNFVYDYSKYKEYIDNRIYNLKIASINPQIIDAIESEIKKELNVYHIDSYNETLLDNTIKINSLTYELSTPIIKNWNLDLTDIDVNFHKSDPNKIIVNYDKKFGVQLLKELIEYQAFYEYNKKIGKMEGNSKSKNNKDIYNFIKQIKIINPHHKYIKNRAKINCYDIILKIDRDRNSSKLVNLMLNNGIGAKNSYGFGFVSNCGFNKKDK